MLPQSTQLITEKSHQQKQSVAGSGISHAFASQRNNSFHHGFLTKTLGLVSGTVLAAGTFFGAFGVAPHGAEALTFGNVGTGSTATVIPDAYKWYATSFTINTGYYLDQLVIQSAVSSGAGINELSASIYGNNSGVPNTASAPVSNLSGTFPVSAAGTVTLTPSTQIGNGQTYWLVVQGNGSGGGAASLGILNSPVSSGSGGSVNKVLATSLDSGATWDAASNVTDAIELAFTVSVPFEFSPVGGVAILATGYGVHQLIKRRRAAAQTEAESTEKTPV